MSPDEPRDTEPLATRPTLPLPDLPGLFDAPVPAAESDDRPQVQDAGDPPASDETPRPRIRWAGIVWGVVLAAVAAAGIGLASAEAPVDGLRRWAEEVEPATLIAGGVLAIGALVLVTGVVGVARHAQKRTSAR